MATGISVQIGKGALFSGNQAYAGGAVNAVVTLPTTMAAATYNVVVSFEQPGVALPPAPQSIAKLVGSFTVTFQAAALAAGTMHWQVDGTVL